MRKHHYVAASVILATLLLTAMLPAAILRVVASYDDDERCASNLYTTNWLQTAANAANTSSAFEQIEDLFSQVYIWEYQIQVYGEVWNWGYSEEPNDVYDRIGHDNTYHSSFATVLYVGHGTFDFLYGHSDNGETPPTNLLR